MRFLRSILASIFFKIALSLSVIFVLYDFTVCTGITFDRPYTPLDARELHGEGRIRFVPLGKFPISTVHALANYYKQKYDLAIELASPMLLPSTSNVIPVHTVKSYRTNITDRESAILKKILARIDRRNLIALPAGTAPFPAA